jgi:alkyl sulfatase BDS1-like metallo-beta-lactamase superfamily hydrolase
MRLPGILSYPIVALVFTGVGLWLGVSEIGRGVTRVVHERVAGAVAEGANLDVRKRLLIEHPKALAAIAEGGAFGGEFSASVAQNMFARDPDAIADARAKMKVVEVAPRTWHIRLPIVNAVLFETDGGLVLVDTGMTPAGPAVLDALRQVSDQPLHTIIYTHGHVDHAYGTWALVEGGEQPEIIAHASLQDRFERYLRLPGSIARYMSQPEEQLPRNRDDLVWPTRTFEERLEIEVGGERFVLAHHPGETDDQLYVWAPERRVLASADYYQGFLPNAGNGKRVQRFIEEWALALREMAALEPAILLPAHGEAISDPARIHEVLSVLADAFDIIVEQTLAGLNEGLRKDQVAAQVALPEGLAAHPTLEERYVTVSDISKMVARRYTGWWDDVPSHWSPSPRDVEARAIVDLAGGVPKLVDVQLASHLADWAWLAAPEDSEVQQLVIDVYAARIVDDRSVTQAQLAYLDAMTAARVRQLADGR